MTIHQRLAAPASTSIDSQHGLPIHSGRGKKVWLTLNLLSILSVGFCAALIWFNGDVWWLGTVAIFAPRWPMLIPVAIMTVGCLIWSRKLLWVHVCSGLLVVGPVMGFCWPAV